MSTATESKAPPSTMRHYSIDEIEELWRLSKMTIIRLFENEPGVLRISAASRQRFAKRRGRITMRVPQDVLDRVHERLKNRTK